MSGNRSKKKKKTSNEQNSELNPLISFNGMNRPVVTQESGSTPPAHRPHSSTSLPSFRPVVTQESGSTPPAHRPHSSTSLPAFHPVVTQESSSTPPAHRPPSTSLPALRPATFQPPAYQPPAYQPPAYQPSTYQTHVYETPAYQPHIPLTQSALFTDHGHFMEMLGTFLPRPQQQPQEQQCQQQPQLQQQPQEHQQQQQPQLQQQPQELQQQQQPQLQQQPQEHQQQQPQLQQQPQQGEEYQIVIHPRRKYNKEVKLLCGKVLVRPGGSGILRRCPNRGAAYAIKKAIKAVYKNFYPTYAKLLEDEHAKKEIFEAFSTLCTWEPHLRDDVESSFHHTAADRLKDLLHDARRAYEVHDNPEDPYRPKWIGREVWNQLLQYWENDPHFKNRSAANKRNRSKGGCLHTQGSASLFAHAQDMVQKNGGDIDIAKVHKETHLRKKTGRYVDLRSEITQATYDDKIREFLQEHTEYSCYDDIPLIIRRDIWMQVAGRGTKKNKYGFGKLATNVTYENLLHVPTPEERCHPTTFPPEAHAEIQRLT
ncbi:uridine/cytidine kinase [Trifolium repens]|nr:uridine/cytidine kinase [Trifolium repens]